jgi:hypothetical protein
MISRIATSVPVLHVTLVAVPVACAAVLGSAPDIKPATVAAWIDALGDVPIDPLNVAVMVPPLNAPLVAQNHNSILLKPVLVELTRE